MTIFGNDQSVLIDTTFWLSKYRTTGLTDDDVAITLDRRNEMSLNRVVGTDLSRFTLAGIPLEVVNNRYQRIHIWNDNWFFVDMYGCFTDQRVTAGMGGTDIRLASERHGLNEYRSNTTDWTPEGQIHKVPDLSGPNYLYIRSPLLQTIYPMGTEPAFAKVRLLEGPGYVNYDSYLSAPKRFDTSLTNLSGLQFDVVDPQGRPYDFSNHNWSCTLLITYEKRLIVDSQLNTRNADSIKRK